MKIAVIGLGYVGLPLSVLLSSLDHRVFAIDKNPQKIESLNKKKLPFAQDEPRLNLFFQKAIKKGNITFHQDFKNCKNVRLIFIAVDTPIKNKTPDINSLIAAAGDIARNLAKGSTVIIESTVAPKTTQNTIIPILEKGSKLKLNSDFFVAVVPERIRPNHIFEQLTTLARVIGISSPKIKPTLKNVYSKITSGELDFVDLTTAEVVKTVENAYRDVNIAFANEIALACEELEVNVWQIRELVNKSPFHNLLKPGAGVGGHCIPKDPILLKSSLKTKMPILTSSRKINDSMPLHILDLAKAALQAKDKDLKSSRLAILGYAYIENSDDTRNSPTQALLDILESRQIKYKVHDPLVSSYNSRSAQEIIKDSDCLILMVAHSNYSKLKFSALSKLMKTKIIIDGRNFFDKEKAGKLGFIYKGVGNV